MMDARHGWVIPMHRDQRWQPRDGPHNRGPHSKPIGPWMRMGGRSEWWWQKVQDCTQAHSSRGVRLGIY